MAGTEQPRLKILHLLRLLKEETDQEHGVSMTRFESRPARSGQWEYYFYIDLQGHPSQAHVAAALKDLQGLCAFYKVLGTYPLAD